MMMQLSVDCLRFAYSASAKPVINDITLALKEAQTALVVGDNGSGKSTLGRLIAGLLSPTSGDVVVKGKAPHKLCPWQRAPLVSYMGQVSHLSILTATLRKEVDMFSRSAPDAIEMYMTWARRYSLPVDMTINPRDLPFPELWRLVLIMYGVLLAPQILVVDEIAAGGNATQENCLTAVMEARSQRLLSTIVMYQRRIPGHFDKVYRLSNAQIVNYE
jgi:energy-coupling factor transporter ATP-binding protein EcfA2